jgi:hypothetical protein
MKYNQELKDKIRKDCNSGELTINLVKKYGLSRRSIDYILNGCKRNYKQLPNKKILIVKDKYYYLMLGLLAGDGTIGKNKYSISFNTTDEDTLEFVYSMFKKICYNVHERNKMSESKFKQNKFCYVIKVDSIDFVSNIKIDLLKENLQKLSSENLIYFINGLFCAEGCVNPSSIMFAQNEPDFSFYIHLISRLIGKPNYIRANQNGCYMAYWNLFYLKDFLLKNDFFNVMLRKRYKMININLNKIRIKELSRYNVLKFIENNPNKIMSNIFILSGRKNLKKNSGSFLRFLQVINKQGQISRNVNKEYFITLKGKEYIKEFENRKQTKIYFNSLKDKFNVQTEFI